MDPDDPKLGDNPLSQVLVPDIKLPSLPLLADISKVSTFSSPLSFRFISALLDISRCLFPPPRLISLLFPAPLGIRRLCSRLKVVLTSFSLLLCVFSSWAAPGSGTPARDNHSPAPRLGPRPFPFLRRRDLHLLDLIFVIIIPPARIHQMLTELRAVLFPSRHESPPALAKRTSCVSAPSSDLIHAGQEGVSERCSRALAVWKDMGNGKEKVV